VRELLFTEVYLQGIIVGDATLLLPCHSSQENFSPLLEASFPVLSRFILINFLSEINLYIL
jgi:hypothetical protein